MDNKVATEYEGQVVVKFFDKAMIGGDKGLDDIIRNNAFEGEVGDCLIVNNLDGYSSKQVLLCGVGDLPCSNKNYIKALSSGCDLLVKIKAKEVFISNLDVEGMDEDWVSRTTARVLQNSIYKIEKIGSEKKEDFAFDEVLVESARDGDAVLLEGVAIGEGMGLARELGDMPSNVCTPSYLANVAVDMAEKYGLDIEVLGEKEMDELGMHSLLSVSKGSIEEPRLISLGYNGGGNEKPIVLVGKGVTFDSGGISLKPGSGMDEMKYDMCGAASVLGTMQAIAEMGAKVNLRVVVPTVENMPAHNASKPGDVVKSMSGQTIEILNTDAEGRMILCDALTFVEKYNPEVVVDVATLTGAVIVALGKHHSGMMTNNQELGTALLSAGERVADSVWQLPLDDEYKELIKSNFADLANIGSGGAGSVTAAVFLAQFTKKYKWAHLDIAGTAWVSGEKKGATGRPVPLLCEYVMNKDKRNG